MSSVKHTPGPWKVNADEYGNVLGVRAANDATICQINWMIRKRGGLQAEANARLIAAAPDLLAVLKEFVKDSECDADGEKHPKDCWHCAAMAAILKAEGGSV